MLTILKGISLQALLYTLLTAGGVFYHIQSKNQSYTAGYKAATLEFKIKNEQDAKKLVEKVSLRYEEDLQLEVEKRRIVERDIQQLNQELVRIQVNERKKIIENTQCRFIDSDLARLRNSFLGDKPILSK